MPIKIAPTRFRFDFVPLQGKALVMSPIIDSTRCILAPASAPEAAKKRVSLSLMVRDDELPPAGDKDAPAATEPKWSVSGRSWTLVMMTKHP